MNEIIADIKYSLRSLLRHMQFSFPVIVLLALGIAGSVSMATIIQQTVLNPLPFRDADRLILLGGAAMPPDRKLVEWWKQDGVFDYLCVYDSGGVNLSNGANPTRIVGVNVTSEFFSVFRVQPQIGRGFTLDEEQNNKFIVVISNRLYHKIFSKKQNAIGQNINLNGINHQIVGIMPPEFNFPDSADVWVPRKPYDGGGAITNGETESQQTLPSGTIGRMKSEITIGQARQKLNNLYKRLAELYAKKGGGGAGDGINVFRLIDFLAIDYKQTFWILFTATIFLMLIACANTGNLMLSRTIKREKELAIRLCLGIPRQRLVRQFFIESLLLSGVSGVTGLVLAYLGINLFCKFGSHTVPALKDVQVNAQTALFTITLIILTGILLSLIPIIHSLSSKLKGTIKDGVIKTTSAYQHYIRRILVIVEISSATALLACSGLVIQSYYTLSEIPPGFDADKVLSFNLDLYTKKYLPSVKPETVETTQLDNQVQSGLSKIKSYVQINRVLNFYQNQLLIAVNNLPGVVSVGGSDRLPLGKVSNHYNWVDSPGSNGGLAAFTHVVGDYFQTMKIPLLKGRSFTEKDLPNTGSKLIVNVTLAKLLWGDAEPIGQIVVLEGEDNQREVIGVVGDVRNRGLILKATPQFYLPYQQPYRLEGAPLSISVVARIESDPNTLIPLLESRINAIDNDIAMFRVRTLKGILSDDTALYRMRGGVIGGLAFISLIMAVVGIYSVISYSVLARIKEIGIRMTLGADPKSIRNLIMREGMALVGAGLLLGCLFFYWLSKLLDNLLYEISRFDPSTLVITISVILVSALTALLIPALRASRVDPSVSLRRE